MATVLTFRKFIGPASKTMGILASLLCTIGFSRRASRVQIAPRAYHHHPPSPDLLQRLVIDQLQPDRRPQLDRQLRPLFSACDVAVGAQCPRSGVVILGAGNAVAVGVVFVILVVLVAGVLQDAG